MHAIKLGFVLLSNTSHPVPSTRIAVLNMFPYLRDAGFDPHIVFEPADALEKPDLGDLHKRLIEQQFSMVYFQKVHGRGVEKVVKKLREAGIITVYGVCDLVEHDMAMAADATIVVTDYLKSLYPAALQHKIHVVHDGIERPDIVRPLAAKHNADGRSRLRAVLVTSADLSSLPVIGDPPDWLDVVIVGRYVPASQPLRRFNSARWKLATLKGWKQRFHYLRFLMHPRITCQAWHPESVYQAMQEADIGIIPIDTSSDTGQGPVPDWKVKSENRLTMKMCIGLPVIATPIPSYLPVLNHGENGFFATDRDEWMAAFEALRDPGLRGAMGREARRSVIERYSMEEQARRLVEILLLLVKKQDEVITVDAV